MKFYLAPLEELTGFIYRNTYHKFFQPMDKYFAPFIAAKQNEGRQLNRKEKADILPENNKGLYLVPQILTNSSVDFIRTAKALMEYGYEEVNLNLGCPSKPVVNRGRGSGFLSHTEELKRFLDRIFSELDIKISIKTRIGHYDPEEFGPLMEIYNQFPLEELIVHPRVQKEFYSGIPHKDVFGMAYEKHNSPLGYNGDIFRKEDYQKLLEDFPDIDSVMLGRGVLVNPGLLGEIKQDTMLDLMQLKCFVESLCEAYLEYSVDEKRAMYKMKEIWCYLRFLFGESNIWEKIKSVNTMDAYKEVQEEFFGASSVTPQNCFQGNYKQRGCKKGSVPWN